MANFISNVASAELTAATLDLSTGNYYAHLVTTVPLLTHSTAADLVLPTIGGYASTPLTGLSYNSTRWTFDSFSFPKYTLVSAPTGVAICKRAGSSPASTDRFICYSDFNNSIGQGISLQVGTYVVNLQFGINGAINFTYRYQYSSGAYSIAFQGIFYLIGSNNNTTSWTCPHPAKVLCSGSNDAVSRDDYNFITAPQHSINLGIYRVKVGTFGWKSLGSTDFLELYGSIDNINWTNLFTNTVGSSVGWNFKTVTDPGYWQYLRTNNTANILEIELFNSSVLSPTINFT